jgi:hypothetical protein
VSWRKAAVLFLPMGSKFKDDETIRELKDAIMLKAQ